MTENALAVIEKIADPVGSAIQMGKACALMCRARNEEEGQVIWIHCLMEGITPIQFMRRYHLIDGKPTMRADAMLGEFRMQGGRHTVIESSPDRAAIVLVSRDGESSTFELTWAQCEESRWPWKDSRDHSKGMKDNWSTPLDRKNMLWARLISDSLRKIAPELVAGVYTPEEMGDTNDDPRPAAPVKTASQVLAEAAAQRAQSQPMAVTDDDVTDVPFEVQSQPEPPSPAPQVEEKRCTKAQREKIIELFNVCEIPQEARDASIKKRGVGALTGLTKDQAQEMIDRLVEMKAKLGKN